MFRSIVLLLLLCGSANAHTVAVFTADWCVPCQTYKRELRGYDLEHRLVFVDIDRHPVIASKMKIAKVPTTIWLANRAELRREVGPLTLPRVRQVTAEVFRAVPQAVKSSVRKLSSKAKGLAAAVAGSCKCGPECRCVNCDCE